jgi:hypothetical protein
MESNMISYQQKFKDESKKKEKVKRKKTTT